MNAPLVPICGTCTYYHFDNGTICGGVCSHRLQPYANVDSQNRCEYHSPTAHVTLLCCCCEDGPCENATKETL